MLKQVGDSIKLKAYPDAGFCNLFNGTSSTQGFVIFLEGNKNTCVLDWGSIKIKRKVSSTLEVQALKETINNAIYIGSLISEFIYDDFTKNKIAIEAYTDNKPVEQSVRSTKQVHERRLRVDMGEVQRLLEDKEIVDIKWIPTNLQLADGLTKRDINMQKLFSVIN